MAADRAVKMDRSTKGNSSEVRASEAVGAPQPPQQKFFEAYDSLSEAIQTAWAEGEPGQRAQAAFAAYLADAYNPAIGVEAQLRVAEAYADYLRSLQCVTPSDAKEPVADAYAQYLKAAAELPDQLNERASAAWNQYTAEVAEFPKQLDLAVDAAYDSYIGSVVRAFSELDTASVPLDDFGSIVQSMVAAGSLVSSSRTATAQLSTDTHAAGLES